MELITELNKRILVLDGATGTAIQKYNLSEKDFLGKIGCNEILNITRGDIIKEIHRKYVEAGADIIETNSFNANKISLADYKIEERAYELAKISAKLASEVRDEFLSLRRKIWIAGSVGPTSKSASIPTGNVPYEREITFDKLKEAYKEQINGLIDGGIDIILIETIFDGINAKSALVACDEIFEERKKFLPVMVSATVNKQGKLLSGQSIESLIIALDREYIISFGLNCSFGAKDLIPIIKKLGKFTDKYISLYPNAGLPNENGAYDETPEKMSEDLKEIVREKGINILGGCCGTHFGHIKAIANLVKDISPRKANLNSKKEFFISGNEKYNFKDKFTIIGERNNVAGSKIFKRLIEEKNYIKALEIARSQIKNGASVIDINMDDGLLNSLKEMERYLRVIQNDPIASKYPIMIDSSDFSTIEVALKNIAGKSIVNSISLKEGEEKFISKAKTIKKYGAIVVVMAFDERGQGVSYERKIEICQRSYNILKSLNFENWEIIFDPNILSIGTGSEADRYNGINYLKACEWIKNNLHCGVVGGLSNLSFAFRGNNLLRASIHNIFLEQAKKIGMNFAIMNPGEKVPILSTKQSSIIKKLILAEEEALDEILSISLKKSDIISKSLCSESIEEKIQEALIFGGSTTFEEDLVKALEKYSPLEIIENILIPGMEKIGKLFEKGELFLPQLIRSASAMNKGIEILTPLLEKNIKIRSKGKILMGTVAGDVHDIGKNIVGTVLKCNGFEIIDLGVMVPKEKIFETALRENVDLITLSGLITPSLKEMENVLRLFNEKKCKIPILIAGATTSKLHTAIKLEPLYKNRTIYVTDAIDTLNVANNICSENREKFLQEKIDSLKKLADIYFNKLAEKPKCELINVNEKQFQFGTIAPKKIGKNFIEFSIKDVESFIDYDILLHNFKVKNSSYESVTLADVKNILNLMKKNDIKVKCSYGIFPCEKKDDSLKIIDLKKTYNLNFQRGKYKKLNLSLSDFFNQNDYIGAFVISVNSSIFSKKDEFLSLLEKMLLTRIVEAGASYLQEYINKNIWKINIRPAVGYSSLEDHSIKKMIFELVEGEKTMAKLTSTFAMTPLSTVCGIYISNPKSFYFDFEK